jgi:hypothetical protein
LRGRRQGARDYLLRRHRAEPHRHCEERKRRSNPELAPVTLGLFRFARNDGNYATASAANPCFSRG